MKVKNLKSLLQSKQKIISRETGYPSQKSGRDGDFQVRRISGQGVFLFYKWNNKWYSTRLTQYRPRTAEHKEKVKVPLGVSPSTVGELSIDSGGNLAVKKDKHKLNHIISVDKDNVADTTTFVKFQHDSGTAHSSSNASLQIFNKDADARLSIQGKASPTGGDSFINFINKNAESNHYNGWCVGLDSVGGTNQEYVWNAIDNTGTTTASTTAQNKMKLTQAGALTTIGTITSSAGVCGGPSVTNYVTNNADDTMAGTLTIDKNSAVTTTSTVNGMHIDVDQTGVMGASQTLNLRGLDLDVNTDAPTHNAAAAIVAYGATINVKGDTSTSTTYNTGLDIYVTGGDTNTGIRMSNQDGGLDFKIRSSANSLDYSTWATTKNGATTIATVDGDDSLAHLTFDADGYIALDAAAITSGDGVRFLLNGTQVGDVTGHHSATFLTLYENVGASTNDYFAIQVGANGETTLSSYDAGGAAAHFKIEAKGNFTLDPAGETFIEPSSGGIKIKETANKISETAGYGQLWVKNDSPNNLYFTDDDDNDIQLTSGLQPLGQVKIAEVTIDESGMNALNTTEQTIVAAQGSNKVIIPTSGMLFINRDASTAQASSTCDLFIGYNGSTSSSAVIYYIRRFMYNESGDRIWHLQHYTGEAGASLTAGDNQPLTVKLDAAVTSGSIDSMKVVVSYHVYDNS